MDKFGRQTFVKVNKCQDNITLLVIQHFRNVIIYKDHYIGKGKENKGNVRKNSLGWRNNIY